MNKEFENIKLRKQISQYRQVAGLETYIDDDTLKGGYRVVNSIQERDNIDCCHRKIGMIVTLETLEEGYKNYRLVGENPCSNNWVEVTGDGVQGPPGPPGPTGETGGISLLTFEVNEEMRLLMNIETNTNLDFQLDENGHLILIN